MSNALLSINIVNAPLLITFYVLSIAAIAYLLIRRPTARWVATALIGILGGAIIGLGLILLLVNVMNAFGGPITSTAQLWVVSGFAGLGLAVVNLWSSRPRRKVIAICAAIIFLLTTGLSVNASYGLNKTIASLFGTTTENPIDAGGNASTSTADPTQPLYKTWKPPADMPKEGKTGTQVIPNTASGFTSRPAGVYLPPAALVKNAPALPLVIMMMGQPGVPDPQYVAPILNAMAAKNNGLAPIVIVADQLGDPSIDPLCLNTKQHGNAETFITQDVVNWAKANLNILHSRQYWTVAGYSNGGECAAYFAAKYPQIWGNFGVLSGDAFAGDENEDYTLKVIFGGDQAAWDKTKPFNIFASRRGAYANTVGVFTVGSNDGYYVGAVKQNYEAAKAAGVNATYYEIPGGDHGSASVDGGIQKMFEILYPRLGLSK